MAWFRGPVKRLAPWLPLVVATGLLAYTSIRAVLAKLGHPGASLDDAYIHFQYARAFAEGHPLRFQEGEPLSTGATSFVWATVLALPYAIGLHGASIVWAAWALSFVALGALAYETFALALPMAGRGAATGAGAMTLAFGGFTWCATSGMEVVPFAWLLAFATRRAAEWTEAPARRTASELRLLAGLALVAPFMRPEGAIISVVLACAIALRPRVKSLRGNGEALGVGALACAPNALLMILTGNATSSTAQVKLLVGNPYAEMPTAALTNAHVLLTQILNGEVWSAEFLPQGGATLACAGLLAVAWRGVATKREFRAVAVLVLALGMFVPCLYVTFLWNRLRYLWPFAPGWFVGLACLARVAGTLASRLDARAGPTSTVLLAGGMAAALATRLEWVIEDVAQSASGIDRQQVSLGRWADANLPANARIGLNDTGAIAYFGHRKTFDIVGLTTPTEGKYWVAGAGSRLEHYERLYATSRTSLPTHFIVYPEWMAVDAVLGRVLHEAVVLDSSILGGQVMRVFDARWDHLGSGEKPWTAHGEIVDTVDVADLESEEAHRYELLAARDGEQVAVEAVSPDGNVVVDGGRTRRTRERFVLNVPRGVNVSVIGRVQAETDASVELRSPMGFMGASVVAAGAWAEVEFELPARLLPGAITLEVVSRGARFTAFHWWLVTSRRLTK